MSVMDRINVTMEGKILEWTSSPDNDMLADAVVSLNDVKVTCPDDKTLQTIVGNTVTRMYDTLMPCK